ncbi:radical SAM protein, partial [Clostridioides difficile]
WDLNIYRGCEHGCKYCYAIYSHKYINSNNYFEEIYVKTNIVEKLERQLKSSKWKKEVINIGGVTDSYQPIEADYKIMPEILNLLIK